VGRSEGQTFGGPIAVDSWVSLWLALEGAYDHFLMYALFLVLGTG
jgi:hypothetical protein